MTYDHELTLISHVIEEDELGNQTPVETKRTVLCGIKSVGRSEFYSAAVKGMKPEFVFVVNKYEYADENKVEFEGKKYSVIRTYAAGMEDYELTCERDVGNG